MKILISDTVKKQGIYLVVGTLIGIIAQSCCYYYISKNPELLKKYQERIEKRHYNNNQTNPNNKIVNNFRGGEIVSATIIANIIANIIITTALEGGVIALGTSFIAWCTTEKELESVILRATINNYFPSKSFILSDKSIVSEIPSGDLEFLCSNALQYLYYILSSPLIPFEEKRKKIMEVLSSHFNPELIRSNDQRVMLLMCLIAILTALALSNPDSYFLLLEQILKYFKEGKIPKWLFRATLRLMKKKSYPIDPEWISTVDKINAINVIAESVDK